MNISEDLEPEFTYNELAQELAKEYGAVVVEDDDITTVMMAKLWNVGTESARKKLNGLVRKGILTTTGLAVIDGARVRVYRRNINP